MRRPLLFLCVCLFVLIALFMHFFSPPPWNSLRAVSVGQQVCISGQIYDKEYGVKEGRETVVLYLQNILISREAEATHQVVVQKENQVSFEKSNEKIKCEVYVDELPCLENGKVYLPCLGNWIVVGGEWRLFQSASNPGEFDVAEYYAVERVCGYLSHGKILSVQKGEQWQYGMWEHVKVRPSLKCKEDDYWFIREGLYRLRKMLVKRLYELFEEKEASILAKMLLGDGSGIDPEIRDLYQESGIVHILSISGLHISMLGMGLYYLLRWCRMPMRGAALLGGLLVILYGLLTGFGVSACRAVGMYLIHMLGEIWNKTYDMLTAMGVLMVGMVMRNPRLVYHSGYLLSFASVCGVGLLTPVLPKWQKVWECRSYDSDINKWKKKRISSVIEGFRISMAVTLFTLPLQLFFFYKVPVYAVLINILIVPFVGIVMVIGFLVLFLPFASFLCPLESAIFSWFEWCCHLFEHMPAHTLLIGRPYFGKILLYYFLLLGIILSAKRIGKIWVMAGLGLCVLLMNITWQAENKITFLDVGQGDCICVQTMDGKSFLFDGGSSSKSNVGEKIILPFLQYEGISSLDAIFLSHADVDHVNGILTLLENDDIEIEALILPDVAEKETEFENILKLVDMQAMMSDGKHKKVPEIIFISEGMYMELECLKVICVHPQKEYEGDDNAYSACYYLELNGTDILLTGDVGGESEEKLTDVLREMGVQDVDVLKVAHHGSRNSTSDTFLQLVKPEIAVISCGKNNWYGHPHVETIERLEELGSRIVITSEYGAITIRCGKKGSTWNGFRLKEE